MRRWSEPVDLRLLLSQTTYNGSLPPVEALPPDEAHVDSATHDVVSECGACGQPKVGPFQYTYEVVISFVGETMV